MTPDIIKDSNLVERVSIKEVWRQLESCREEGLLRSIGVMNCPVVMFLEIMTFCHIKPALNCLELHPYFTQEDAVKFYKKFGLPIAAYAPIHIFEDEKVPFSEELKKLNLLKE